MMTTKCFEVQIQNFEIPCEPANFPFSKHANFAIKKIYPFSFLMKIYATFSIDKMDCVRIIRFYKKPIYKKRDPTVKGQNNK